MKTKKTKKTKKICKRLLEIAAFGAVAASDWVSGSGRHSKKRAIPDGAVELVASKAALLPGRSGKAAKALLKRRPRVQFVIVPRSWRGGLVAAVAAAKIGKPNHAAIMATVAKIKSASTIPHPATAEIYAEKVASGLSWTQFESAKLAKL